MAIHLKKVGWHETACGLKGDRDTTSSDESVTCSNCLKVVRAANLATAWSTIRPIRKTYYLKRAGFGVDDGLRLMKSKPSAWTTSERNRVRRQLASNPVLSRLINVPHKEITRGGSGDNSGRVAHEWQKFELQRQGRCCPHCGGMV